MSGSEYKVHKILNNNVILAVDQYDRQEVILIGKGIGFCCKVNQVATFEENQVDKIFLTLDEKIKRDFNKLIKQFNSSVIGISEEIISLAERKRLFELADLVLDNCVPKGDSLLDYNGVPSGPASTISGTLIVNSIVAETLKILSDEGHKLPIFTSQNVDGYNNDHLYEKYEGRIKHI